MAETSYYSAEIFGRFGAGFSKRIATITDLSIYLMYLLYSGNFVNYILPGCSLELVPRAGDKMRRYLDKSNPYDHKSVPPPFSN